MNRKQLTLLVVLLIVLGAAGLYIQQSHNRGAEAGEAGAGKKILGEKFPVNDVTHIVIKQGTNELNLVKKDDVWRVRERGDYPASFSQISDFLIKLSGLKVAQSEDIGASQLARMQLVTPGQGTNSGVLLELKGAGDKTLKSVLLGKKHSRKGQDEMMGRFGGADGMADGRYVMAENDKTHALLVGDPLNNAEPKPESWLDKDFFRIEKAKTIAVTYPSAATNSWKLTRETETGEWKLADAKADEKLDTTKLGNATSPFGSPTFTDVLWPAGKPEEHGFDKPAVVSVETFEHFNYSVKVGKSTGEGYPIQVAVTADLPKERTAPKDEKPEDKAKADKAWNDEQKHFQDKLKREQSYASWTYVLPNWNVDSVLKVRKDFLADKEKKDDSKKDNKSATVTPAKDDLSPADVLGTSDSDK